MQNVRANSPKLYGEILKYRKGSKYLARLNPNPHHYKYLWLQQEKKKNTSTITNPIIHTTTHGSETKISNLRQP